MAEYIEREALLEKQYEVFHKGTCRYRKVVDAYDIAHAPAAAVQPIAEKPAADCEPDVAPVVHGKWLPFGKRGIYGYMYACSECKAKYDGQSPYCPNCGAKMDGEQRECSI